MKTCPATIDGKTGMKCTILQGTGHGPWHEAHGTYWNYDGRFAPRHEPEPRHFVLTPPPLDADKANEILSRGGQLRATVGSDHWEFTERDGSWWVLTNDP